MGIPLLFPVAVFEILVLYIVEKLMIYYSYRQPPMYDEKLNNRVLSTLTYAPILFLSFGYWMMSNKQLFSNDNVVWFVQSSDVKQSGHIWTSVFKKEGYHHQPGVPLLIGFWVLFILIVFRNSFFRWFVRVFPSARVGEIEIDEDLDNYFKTLDDEDRKWSLKEEENCRNVLNMKILAEHTLERLNATELGKSHMQGVHTYDILANPLYLDDFQYFSAALEDRDKYIIDGDDNEGNDSA